MMNQPHPRLTVRGLLGARSVDPVEEFEFFEERLLCGSIGLTEL